jgi:16S rRNA (uracil1498-N3)-methyltransferase
LPPSGKTYHSNLALLFIIATVRIIRLYHPDSLECGCTIQLTSDNSNHLIRVLRAKQNHFVTLFNGDGYDYQCKISDTNSKKTSVLIETKNTINNESNLSITLLQGLSRHNRMETTIQKSVELGVKKIIPVLCQRSNVKMDEEKILKKHQHWNNVSISACEQSGRCIIPEITKTIQLNEIGNVLQKEAFKILLNPRSRISLKNNANTNQLVEVFIGPEGGINDDEIQYLKDINFNDIMFGPRILRTETAGPAIISALQVLWGDL